MKLLQAMQEARRRSKLSTRVMWGVCKDDDTGDYYTVPYGWWEEYLPKWVLCSYWAGNIEFKPNKKGETMDEQYTDGDYIAAFLTLCCFGAFAVGYLTKLLGMW